jgi:LAO/AO transport system kinase
VNKADGSRLAAANEAASDLRHAMRLLHGRHPGWERQVVLASSIDGGGIGEAWDAVAALHRHLADTGALAAIRREQAVGWMWDEVRQALVEHARARLGDVGEVVQSVRSGVLAPTSAAQQLLTRLDSPRDAR